MKITKQYLKQIIKEEMQKEVSKKKVIEFTTMYDKNTRNTIFNITYQQGDKFDLYKETVFEADSNTVRSMFITNNFFVTPQTRYNIQSFFESNVFIDAAKRASDVVQKT